MKKILYILLLLTFAGSLQLTKAQHKIAIQFFVQATNVGAASIYADTINEGQVYSIKSATLPSSYSKAQNLYDALAGSEFYFQSGSLNQDISIIFDITGIDINSGQYTLGSNNTPFFFNANFAVYDWSGKNLLPEPFDLNSGTYAVIKINKSTAFTSFLTASGINLATALTFAYEVSTGFDPTGITTYDSANSVTALISHFSHVVGSKTSSLTAVKEQHNNIPTQFALKQNYPNPFNPTTNIEFDLPQRAYVQLDVYNLLGEKVSTLVNSNMNAGTHSVTFNPGNLSSGLYIYQLKAGDVTMSRKMLFMK